MTIPTAQIWKSATASARPTSRSSEKNIHIGQTLRDLYFNEETPANNGRFSELLDELDHVDDPNEGH